METWLYTLVLLCGLASAQQDYTQSFPSVCVGDGNAFTASLPCPPGLLADCIYSITAAASGAHWYEFDPSVIFVVFGSSDDYTNWNNKQPYNAIAGPYSGSDVFISGAFYVPSGSTFIFVAYNDNYIEDMDVGASVEYYPNTLSGDATSVGTQGALEGAAGTMSNAELFAFGFAVGVNDAEPYSPPPTTCLQSMTAAFNDVNSIIVFASQGDSTAELIMSLVTEMFSDFNAGISACDPNSCPGFLLNLFTDALSDILQAIPVIDVVDDAVRGAELLYNGYDLMEDIYNIVDAAGTDVWYQRGYITANMVKKVRELSDDLRRRGGQNATRHTLRHHDGVVRTLRQWRTLYGRTGLYASTPSLPASSGPSMGRGAVVGIVVGAACMAVMLAVGVVLAVRRRRLANATTQQGGVVPDAVVSSVAYMSFNGAYVNDV